MEKLLLEVEEAASVLSIGRSIMYDLLRAGSIQSVKVGRRRLVPVNALHDFVERQQVEQGV